jgi:putative ABC transport system substrate-binding protein
LPGRTQHGAVGFDPGSDTGCCRVLEAARAFLSECYSLAVAMPGLDKMRRREFLGVLGGAAATWPFTARAQPPVRLPTIGFLGSTGPSVGGQWVTAFVQRLHELGWIEGRTVAIEYRWAEGRSERFSEIVAEFVRLKVDVILTHNTPTVLAAKQATSVVPIGFATAGDPVGSGLVASLARPGGNVTGLSSQGADSAGKRLELLREVVPRLRRLAVMANLASSFPVLELGEVQRSALRLGLEVAAFDIRRAEDIALAFDALNGSVEALYVVADPLTISNRNRINTLALGARLPTMYTVREFVEAGGLISYGPNWNNQFRRAADYVDKILRGARPGDIPVEQPTKFDLVFNLVTAKALGLEIPPMLLARADEVIE